MWNHNVEYGHAVGLTVCRNIHHLRDDPTTLAQVNSARGVTSIFVDNLYTGGELFAKRLRLSPQCGVRPVASDVR